MDGDYKLFARLADELADYTERCVISLTYIRKQRAWRFRALILKSVQ